jgi:predicted PurR-regulated permease PerM
MSRAERRATFALKVLVIIAAALFVLSRVLDFFGAISTTGLLIVASMFLAYLIYPLVRRLQSSMPTGVAILIAYALIAGLAVIALVTVVPPLADESQKLVRQVPAFVSQAQTELATPTNPVIRRIPLAARTYLVALPAQLGTLVQTYAFDAAQKTIGLLLSAVSILAALVIVPVLSAYMLIDASSVKSDILGLFSARARPAALAIIDDLDKVVGGFIRGQLIDGAIVGVMIFVLLLVLHVPYALLIGVFAGLLNFVPYAGAVIGFIPAVLLALFTNGPTSALIVAAMFAVIQQVDGNFIAPRVMKENVGLSPLYIVIAILVGTELFGLAGTFLAVPVAAMLRVLREHLVPGGRPTPAKIASP